MFRRVLFVAAVVMTTLMLSFPAFAAAPPSPVIAGVEMAKSVLGTECGVEITATFENMSHGRYWVVFGFHSSRFSTTTTIQEFLDHGQASASARLGVCPAGDTWDRGEVTLYKGGGRLVDSASVATEVICPDVSVP